MTKPLISVIIPTYNRPDRLARLLDCLARQSFPTNDFEVIAVDDGSEVDYAPIAFKNYPFSFNIFHQDNQGEAIARNIGVNSSQGDLLAFLDDDMIPESEYLSDIYQESIAHPDAILIGNMDLYQKDQATCFYNYAVETNYRDEFGEVGFTSILAGVMTMARDIYLSLGGMKPRPGEKRGGWIDMEFAYRAHLNGIRFYRVKSAIAHHDDYTSENLSAACKRSYNTSRLAVRLFHTHPLLIKEIPMFADKTSINFTEDSVIEVIKKTSRFVISSRTGIKVLESLIRFIEYVYPKKAFLYPLYRWVIGGYIYRGFQAGIQEYGPLSP